MGSVHLFPLYFPYSYDSANRLKSIVNGGGKTYSFQYDTAGRRTKLSLPNGATANYSYDSTGRLTSLIHKASNGSVITQYSYTHDKVGNRLSKTNTDVKNDYSYDAIYRLLQSLPTRLQGKDKEQEHKAETYTYDPVGNRLTGPETKDTYLYNPSNQLISDRKHQYEYDKNGNLIKKTEIDDDGETETWTYSYDYENRLIKVVKQEEDETKIITFKYDPFGRRIEKKVTEAPSPLAGEGGGEGETKTYNYVYDNEDIILEYLTKTEDGKTKTEGTKYVHGPGIDEPLAIERKGEVYFYHADGLGSITALTDKKQKVVESYTYSAFGEVKRKGDKVKNTYTFTGREWDEEIEQYYLRARYLNPTTGAFTSFDRILHPVNGPKTKTCSQSLKYPIFESLINNPQKLNPYVYVENRPTVLTDPTGLAAIGNTQQRYSCISSCVQGLLSSKWNEFKCCATEAGIAGVTFGTVTCAAIVAFEPYLAPTFPACAGLASTSTTVIGVGLCMTKVEVGGLAAAAGCVAGCYGW